MYLIVNNKKIEIVLLNTFFKKLVGLINKKNKIDKVYVLNNCNSIHTFFMKQKIDVCITNKNKKILYLSKNVKKNKIILPKKGVYYTFEMPLETVKYLKIGDYLNTINF